ncbi:putative DNA helicase [Helianthus debilis subsp. tardiflorus]
MYIYDTDNEVSNRLNSFSNEGNSTLSSDTLAVILSILDSCNNLVKLFRTARDLCSSSETPSFGVCLYGSQSERCYHKPSPGCLGAIIADSDAIHSRFDIIIRVRDGIPQRINKLHPSYMALQYPLLFPFGDKGWSPDLMLRTKDGSRKKLTVNKYYSYLLHDRSSIYTLLLRGGRLFQQFVVDAYVCIEESRLDYVRRNQNALRSEFLQGIHDAIQRGDTEGREVGKRTFLPDSFVGGPRYMYKHYQDALAICRVHGNPQYFVTFTCNVKWPEIQRYLSQFPNLKAQDRPDIIARVFAIKVKSLIKFLRNSQTFGQVVAGTSLVMCFFIHSIAISIFRSLRLLYIIITDLYTIEFQKRGLPHCHLLVWVAPSHKIREATQIDNFISAEIPDPSTQPHLHQVITDLMMHGPCGVVKPNSPCMISGSCSKEFPKTNQEQTSFDDKGYAHYKRRSNGFTVNKGGVQLDNRYVVPYNPMLCSRFMAHINVEYCGWSMLIKYLFKYISKGVDRIHYKIKSSPAGTEVVQNTEYSRLDEIQNFLDGRFICPHEASWRIFNFDIHDRNPAVQVLAVHLENMQNVSFRDKDVLDNIANNEFIKRTTLTEWLSNNVWDVSGRHLRYFDYLNEYRWDLASKRWIRRTTTKVPSIGRLIYIHPACGEAFYLRMLLAHQKGCQSFNCIKTVNGHVCATYRNACERLGLIGDDREWSCAFEEASLWATSSELRSLFIQILMYCDISDPLQLWNAHWPRMADDGERSFGIVNDDERREFEFGLPMPTPGMLERLRNRMLMEEKNYDRHALSCEHQRSLNKLNTEQRMIYDFVITGISTKTQTLSFVYGHGGTGKTFLWTTILSGLRSLGKVVLVVAASGIASLLLPSGRTAHSRFKIPLDLTDESVCHIKKGTHLGMLIKETVLIVWDEAPMSGRRCYEALDRALKDLADDNTKPFGGKSILLGGDFRQTLPVVPKSTKATLLALTLPRSHLWRHFKVFKLTENMRLQRPHLTAERQQQISTFSSWLVGVGDGEIGVPDIKDPIKTKILQIPDEYLILHSDNALTELIRFIYDEKTLIEPTVVSLSAKAIVCPKNDTVDDINLKVINMVTGTSTIYHSIDSLIPTAGTNEDIESLYPREYLNLLNFSGLPPHILELKVNAPIILLRNLNPIEGLCNGTRMIVTQLLSRIIEAQIMTGKFIGKRVFIPKISLIHKDKELPFEFKRKQFPIRLCYAMTINKSQGQSLDKIGIYLPQPVFTHGQLYVALSRATAPESLKILIVPDEDHNHNKTRNIAFSDFLTEIKHMCRHTDSHIL